jgi:hypothetical protein
VPSVPRLTTPLSPLSVVRQRESVPAASDSVASSSGPSQDANDRDVLARGWLAHEERGWYMPLSKWVRQRSRGVAKRWGLTVAKGKQRDALCRNAVAMAGRQCPANASCKHKAHSPVELSILPRPTNAPGESLELLWGTITQSWGTQVDHRGERYPALLMSGGEDPYTEALREAGITSLPNHKYRQDADPRRPRVAGVPKRSPTKEPLPPGLTGLPVKLRKPQPQSSPGPAASPPPPIQSKSASAPVAVTEFLPGGPIPPSKPSRAARYPPPPPQPMPTAPMPMPMPPTAPLPIPFPPGMLAPRGMPFFPGGPRGGPGPMWGGPGNSLGMGPPGPFFDGPPPMMPFDGLHMPMGPFDHNGFGGPGPGPGPFPPGLEEFEFGMGPPGPFFDGPPMMPFDGPRPPGPRSRPGSECRPTSKDTTVALSSDHVSRWCGDAGEWVVCHAVRRGKKCPAHAKGKCRFYHGEEAVPLPQVRILTVRATACFYQRLVLKENPAGLSVHPDPPPSPLRGPGHPPAPLPGDAPPLEPGP